MTPKATLFTKYDTIPCIITLTQPIIKLHLGRKRKSRIQRPKTVFGTTHGASTNLPRRKQWWLYDWNRQQHRLRKSNFGRIYGRGGQLAVLQIFGFTVYDLQDVLALGKTKFNRHGPLYGEQGSCTPFDVFFIAFLTVKHGSTWYFLARMFRMCGPTFERRVVNLISF